MQAEVQQPAAPDPRDVFWNNINSAMHNGVQEVPSTGAAPPVGYGAAAQAGLPAGPANLANLANPYLQNPADFEPDGIAVPGPMSMQLSKQFPDGVPQPDMPAAPRRSPQPHAMPHALPPAPLHAHKPGIACPGCSASLEAGSRFCGECGFRLEVRIIACHLCGAPLEPNSRFCGECGSQLHDKNPGAQAAMAAQVPAISEEQQRYETYLSGVKPSQQGWVTKLKKLLD
jgi:predicted nucleic acid-binding Zn ribbon protein